MGRSRRPYVRTRRAGRRTAVAIIGLLMLPQVAAGQWRPLFPTSQPAPGQPPTTEPAAAPETQPASVVPPSALAQPESALPKAIEPRFELYIPSVHKLRAEVQRSNGGFLLGTIANLIREAGSLAEEGMDVEEAGALFSQLETWPDTRIDAATYAPDTQGRPRWAIRFAWPLDELHARIRAALDTEAARDLFKGVRMSPLPDGGYEIALPDYTLAYLLAAGDVSSVMTSFQDVKFPEQPFTGTAAAEREAEQGAAPDGGCVIACRLNLGQTEKDSGATWLSSLRAINDVTYTGRVNEGGDWVEQVDVHWPPGVGLLAKNVMDKVKHSYFVPDDAFGAVVLSGPFLPGALEGMAGFGPQMVSTEPGEYEMIGEFGPGPIVEHTRSSACFTVLPGTGFFPIPDLIVQVRAKSVDSFHDDIRAAIEKANKRFKEREQPEVWHEGKAAGRVYFWNDGAGQRRGMMTPAVERTVLFLTEETDARGQERDFLVIGITTTSPEDLVRRWVGLNRAHDRRFLPTTKKPNGQAWINWAAVYEHLSPYLNVGLSSFTRDVLLPDADAIRERLTDGFATLKMRYTGLTATHQGPVPVGVVAIPVMLTFATEENRSGSDLARERNAARTLKVLYHHATLFHKDQGRWPAEVAELDGYVDFAGNRHLLRVDKSSKQRWSAWTENLFGLFGDRDDHEDEDEEQDDQYAGIDDSIYVIEWDDEGWRLGFAPDTFEHLTKLYIDEAGRIHRVEKTESDDSQTKEEGSEETKG